MANSIRLKFLGVRAIHPAPNPCNQATGGNTSCLAMFDGKDLIFINAGFGINTIDENFLPKTKNSQKNFECGILFSDFLWDSTMGLPSFAPMHKKSNKIKILTGTAPKAASHALDEISSHLFSPFNGLKSLPAKTAIEQVQKVSQYGDWFLSAMTLPNPLTPDGATIWRITHPSGFDAGVILLCDKKEETLAKAAGFLNGCQVLICAASTSPDRDQWDAHRTGFGEALSLAIAAKANTLYLTQFHPEMPDHALQGELIKLQAALSALQSSGAAGHLEIHLATELQAIQPSLAGQQRKSS